MQGTASQPHCWLSWCCALDRHFISSLKRKLKYWFSLNKTLINFWAFCKIIASQILSASLACEVLSFLFGPRQAGDTPHYKRSFSSHIFEETSVPSLSDTHDHPGKSQAKSVCHVCEASVTFIVSVVKNVLRQLFPDLAPAALVFLSFSAHSRFSVIQIESNQFLDWNLLGNFLHKGNWKVPGSAATWGKSVSTPSMLFVSTRDRTRSVVVQIHVCVPMCTFMSVFVCEIPCMCVWVCMCEYVRVRVLHWTQFWGFTTTFSYKDINTCSVFLSITSRPLFPHCHDPSSSLRAVVLSGPSAATL